MTKKELNALAQEMYDLELKCQHGEDIQNNVHKMQEIADKLSFSDLIKLDAILSDYFRD